MCDKELKPATAALKQHSTVQDCIVLQHQLTGETPRLVAYVIADAVTRFSRRPQAEREWLSRISQAWEVAYSAAVQETEQQGRPMADPYLQIHSWTNLVNRSEEIHELMECSASRMRALRPKRVLEIGCGSGQILTRLAPDCLDYWGTDISELALRNLRSRKRLPNVTLLPRQADDFTGIPTSYFDGVIMNSVLEFFPSSDYLLRVLEQALKVIVPGGFVFLGDIGNRALREVYHYAEQARQAGDEQPIQRMMQVAQRRLALDYAFCVAPDFFFALPKLWPQIRHVEVKLLRGHYYNAISQLHADTHYDAILHVDSMPPVHLETPWLDWQKEPVILREIIQRLIHTQPKALGITGLPSARLLSHLTILKILSQPTPPQTAGELREKVLSMADGEGLEAWWNLDRRLPYQMDISWTNLGQDALCDVVFRQRDTMAAQPASAPVFPHRKAPDKLLDFYTNNPSQKQLDQDLVSTWVEFLQSQLPAQWIPQEFVFVETLPHPGSNGLKSVFQFTPESLRVRQLDYSIEP